MSPLARVLLAVVRAYQHVVSPLMSPRCRFLPSCSSYAVEALSTYGAVRGGWLAVRRVARCQPLCRGGWDPVPDVVDQDAGGGPDPASTGGGPGPRRTVGLTRGAHPC